MKVTVNLGWLYANDRIMWAQLKSKFGSRQIGTAEIEVGEAYVEALKRLDSKYPLELWLEQEAQRQCDEAHRIKQEQLEVDKKAAFERLDAHFKMGLLQIDTNKVLIATELQKLGGYLSVPTLEKAIQTLTWERKLQWKPAELSAPEPEPPVKLADGSDRFMTKVIASVD